MVSSLKAELFYFKEEKNKASPVRSSFFFPLFAFRFAYKSQLLFENRDLIRDFSFHYKRALKRILHVQGSALRIKPPYEVFPACFSSKVVKRKGLVYTQLFKCHICKQKGNETNVSYGDLVSKTLVNRDLFVQKYPWTRRPT